MIVIPGLSRPLEAAGRHITSWDDSGSRLIVETSSTVQWAACPRCAGSSSRPHGRYRCWIADSPYFGKPVTLTIEVRRFKCIDHGCSQRTFSERIETLAVPGQ